MTKLVFEFFSTVYICSSQCVKKLVMSGWRRCHTCCLALIQGSCTVLWRRASVGEGERQMQNKHN
jgi:hypothetical protein